MRLARILIYPIKSLPGIQLAEVEVLPCGALLHDRRWALVDEQGAPVHAKRTALLARLRASIDPAGRSMSLALDDGQPQAFHLDRDRAPLERWLSEVLALTVRLLERADGGFPDDTEAPGPTLVSTASLEMVAGWFPGTVPTLDVAEARRRMRANLEIEGGPPFWEDQLFGPDGQPRLFQVGEARFWGVNPCQRCVVPSRDSQSGQEDSHFARQFSEHRRETLPAWAPKSRFDHYYRMAVNTRSADGATTIVRVGDEVRLLD